MAQPSGGVTATHRHEPTMARQDRRRELYCAANSMGSTHSGAENKNRHRDMMKVMAQTQKRMAYLLRGSPDSLLLPASTWGTALHTVLITAQKRMTFFSR